MQSRKIRWFLWPLIIVFAMGCAAKEPAPEIQTVKTPPATTPTPEPKKIPEMVAVTASRLNLRTEGASKSRILAVLKQGDTLTVLAREGSWVKVQTDSGKQGWVSERYITAVEARSVPTSPTPQIPAATAQTPKSSPSVAVSSKAGKGLAAASPQTGAFVQEDAIVLYNRHRQTLVDGDFNAFFASIHDPPGPDEANPEEFAKMKGFLLKIMPDLAVCEVLKFTRNDRAALLVVRSDLDKADSITLNPLFFIAAEGDWKVQFDFISDTFPSQNPQADKAAITRALESNPKLQLSAAIVEDKPENKAAAASKSPPPPVAAVPSENGKAQGELVINGETTALKYAYAYSEPGITEKTKMNTIVILSNMALEDDVVNDWVRRTELEEAGKLRCVELTINTDERVISRRLRHAVFDGSPSGVSSLEVFEPRTVNEGIIAGKAYTTTEGDIFGVTYQYRVSFRAQIKQPTESPESGNTTGASSWSITPPTKEELTSVPRYIKDAVEPLFQLVDVKAVVEDIKIISGRNTAMFGFNTPEVVLYLPRIGNSAYAVVEFDDPALIDSQGTAVPFELESGGYDDDTFSAEIRVIPKEGTDPVEFAKIRGSGRIKYPLKVNTQTVKQGEAGKDIILDGPFVTYTVQREMDFSFTDIGPVRAYDGTGRRIEEHGYSSTITEAEDVRRTIAFRGDIAEIQYDHAQQWEEIEFNYDLPRTKPLPESYSGRPSARPPKLVDTPGGRVRIKLISAKQPEKDEQPAKSSEADKTETKTADKKKPCNSLQECREMSDLQIAIAQSPTQGEAQALKFIESGADLTVRDKIHDTPLHTAVNAKPLSKKIIQALLEAGAEVDAVNEYGYTPLHNLSQGAGPTEAPFAKMLIAAGADVNIQDHYGMTPLYHMTIHGLGCKGLEVARVLIKAGADVNIKDKYGKSPLDSARENHCDDLAKLFIDAGAQ